MASITYIAFDGVERTVDVAPGTTIMEGAVANDVAGIDAVCGGNCYCGTCRIYVPAEWFDRLPAPAEDELGMIEASGETDLSARLSCQLVVTDEMDGLAVRMPETQK